MTIAVTVGNIGTSAEKVRQERERESNREVTTRGAGGDCGDASDTIGPLLTDTPNNGHLHITDNLLMYITIKIESPCKGHFHATEKTHFPNLGEAPRYYMQ